MELDRRVQIRVAKAGTQVKGLGSGYLVAPRLVLTAAHVLDNVDPARDRDSLTVCQPDAGGQQFPAMVRWQRWDDAVDAALIEVLDGRGWQVPQSLSDLLTRSPQRYGLFIGTRPNPVTATGFPRLQRDTGSGKARRLDEQLTGWITPGTGALAGRYEVTSTTPTPGSAPPGGRRWSGISGAAVLSDDGYSGDLLCGVVSRDRHADGGTRLTATTAKNLLADPGFRTLVTEHTGWEPVLEPVEPAALLAAATVNRTFRSPAALLRSDTEAVAFHGRDSELTDLRAWCETGTDALAIRVMTGPGGQGKTRLARHLTDALSRDGWVTGHLRSDLSDDPPIDGSPPDFTMLNTALPLLLVVDYAETRPRLLRRLITHLHSSRSRVRLLLLARSDGEWRTGSFQAVNDVRELLEEAPVHPLGPLIPEGDPDQDLHTAFRQAVGDLALLLPRFPAFSAHDWQSTAGMLHPPADLDHKGYGNVLTLQMTALVALLQRGSRPVDTAPGAPPERTLLKHEERFWQDSAKAPAYRLDLPTPILSAAVATAALCGAGTKEEALRVIATLPGLPADQQDSAAAWLASLYPNPAEKGGDQGRYWGSLQPDRVAEYHASQILKDHGITLPALLAAGTTGQQAQIITVLARAATALYNANRTKESEHVLSTLDTALDVTPLVPQVLQTASASLPNPSRIITSLAIRITHTLVRAQQETARRNPATIFDPSFAISLSNLSNWLAEAGRQSEALAAEQDAVEIWRHLTHNNPTAFEPRLAISLSNLGVLLSGVGRWGEAVTVGQEAVEIYRRLADDNPAAFEPDLAFSMCNLGTQLSGVGRWGEAVTAGQEAVEIYRRLADDNPAAYRLDLARSLTNLGVQLSKLERRGEALNAAEEAMQEYRRLAADNPAAHERDFATSLSAFGNRLSQAGRVSEALNAAEEAAQIRRRLAADNPAAHEPHLSESLSDLCVLLSSAGRQAEGLAVGEEAVEIIRRLAADNPTAYEPNLATSLSNLGMQLSKVGRQTEGLAAAEKAVEITRRLAADNPTAHEPNLATSLSVSALVLAVGGELLRALSATEQAVDLYRRHVDTLPSALSKLHGVLGLQAKLLDRVGHQQEAEKVRRWLRENPPPPDSHS
ncbi:tetratricopeptide repeat protein [Streptomyces sp. NRRL S-448]|uniref:tetratricopeptide repeat protein n=1 Tax=Streptomyces sp. NRRL S-448 TaxID=1463907 RepID=UPI003566A140